MSMLWSYVNSTLEKGINLKHLVNKITLQGFECKTKASCWGEGEGVAPPPPENCFVPTGMSAVN